MKIKYVTGDLAQVEGRCLITFVLADGTLLNGTAALQPLAKKLAGSGELGKGFGVMVYVVEPSELVVDRLLFFSLGDKVKNSNDLRRAASLAWKDLRKKNIRQLVTGTDGLNEDQLRAVVEGFFLGEYQYSDLKTDKENLPAQIEELVLHGQTPPQEQVERWRAICDGTNRARDLCQMPANILTPTRLAEIALAWGEVYGFKTTVFEQPKIAEIGMGALLAVSQGSQQEPRFMIMEYEPRTDSGKTIALVGKAVTFDSGGLSLKPPSGMIEMKGDMAGGAAVLGIMTTLREIDFPHRVVGLVPSVENMPSGSATRPSDVVRSLAGITVEINNTDAEGRLILADALTYAAHYQPDYVIDFATLTGACLVALGSKVCGVMGNHQPLVEAILEAGRQVFEPFWQLPLVEEYKEQLKSQVADMTNISPSRWGGAITAGLFLERFARNYRWAHCDIAASIFEKGDDYQPAGGTGIGVRMAVEMMALLE